MSFSNFTGFGFILMCAGSAVLSGVVFCGFLTFGASTLSDVSGVSTFFLAVHAE